MVKKKQRDMADDGKPMHARQQQQIAAGSITLEVKHHVAASPNQEKLTEMLRKGVSDRVRKIAIVQLRCKILYEARS
jgi:hypothetical protein